VGPGKTRGLIKKGQIWHIDKIVRGCRIRESAGTGDLQEAERFLARRMEELRQVQYYGARPKRTWREAATRYVLEKRKKSLPRDAICLKQLDPFIGTLTLENIHMGALQPFIETKRQEGLKDRTLNYPLQVVRHILNLAAQDWIDERGLSWLSQAPKIRLFRITDARQPRPITWDEQVRLLNALPSHLRAMTLFKVNTGCRESEVCGLRWIHEAQIPEMGTSVFIIPRELVKNSEDRLVVLNRTATEVVEAQRGLHPTHVFSYLGKPVGRMYASGWRNARVRAGLPDLRVHDLKHTFGRRLRAAGVSFEDRQDLLGHKSARITTHYSQAELERLIAAANKICGDDSRKSPTLVVLRANNASCGA
jgi:integrase